jgi:hypothetical protein
MINAHVEGEETDSLLEGDASKTQCVSFRRGDYHGPMARIDWDDDWLHIVTDDHEGHAMLNIEALPKLRLALAKIAKLRRQRLLAQHGH